jgi:hypothetical protein
MKTTKTGLPIVNQEQLEKLLKDGTKGILCLGQVGVGKTEVFKKVFRKQDNEVIRQGLRDLPALITANQASTVYALHGTEGLSRVFDYQLQGRAPLILDDIGTELIQGNYGVKLDVIEWLILECYNVNAKMYLTTNLSLDELTGRYGIRVVDRLKERCYVVVLEGKSWRKESFDNNITQMQDDLNKVIEKPEPVVDTYSDFVFPDDI